METSQVQGSATLKKLMPSYSTRSMIRGPPRRL